MRLAVQYGVRVSLRWCSRRSGALTDVSPPAADVCGNAAGPTARSHAAAVPSHGDIRRRARARLAGYSAILAHRPCDDPLVSSDCGRLPRAGLDDGCGVQRPAENCGTVEQPAGECSSEGRALSQSVFDEFVDNYEDACERGLSLSGESRDYFARARITHTKRLASALGVDRLVDFGCGLGHSAPHLGES